MNLAADLDLAIGAARAAGAAVLGHFGRPIEVHLKSADQPVTLADLEADRILREHLAGVRPDYGWLSEESVDEPARLEAERLWIVDPIDGTNAFIAGRGEFVISIGLVERGRPVLGVALNPVTAELYHAVAGGGAFLNGAPIRVRAPEPPVVVLASRSEISSGEVAELGAGWEVHAVGSTAYRVLKVAEGAAHLYATLGTKAEWDLAAAAVVLAEAGGVLGDATGESLRFNQPVPTISGLVAAGNPEVFAEAVRRLAAKAGR